MNKVEPVKIEDVNKWVEINTFNCPYGRVSPETCEKLRQRPTIKELMKSNGKKFSDKKITQPLKPTCCENCKEWERLAQEVYEKRAKYKMQKVEMAENKKIIICPECGQEKPYYARGLCRTCYDRILKREKREKEKENHNKDLIVSIDFSIAPHLLEELKRKAEHELRPLEMQILWEIKKSLGIKNAEKQSESAVCVQSVQR